MMNIDQAAKCLEKLGNPTRLEIVRLLVRAGEEGLSVGEIQEHLDIPASTLSHHVAHLANAGLIQLNNLFSLATGFIRFKQIGFLF